MGKLLVKKGLNDIEFPADTVAIDQIVLVSHMSGVNHLHRLGTNEMGVCRRLNKGLEGVPCFYEFHNTNGVKAVLQLFPTPNDDMEFDVWGRSQWRMG